MDPSDASKRRTAATAELRHRDAARSLDESLVDLSAPPASEDGSLAELLGGVARAPSTEPPVELTPGAELGVYRIVRRLGAGGMGVVYIARDLELQRDVAVKVHRATIGTERLYREAVAMAQLAHPNVVTIHGVGRVDGRLYIAMEYVPGDNLSDWLAAAPRSWRDVLDVMLAAGEGLAAAHAAGFVHRDIKPHNILVGLDGRPRVGDFGLVRVTGDSTRMEAVLIDEDRLPSDVTRPGHRAAPATTPAAAPTAPAASPGFARSAGPAPSPARAPSPGQAPSPTPPSRPSGSSPLANDLTAIGTTLGTPTYMAPEQLAGRAVDARADQFGFCVVLYEALYGHRPWQGVTVAELHVELGERPPREPTRPGVPAWLWPVLQRGLSRDPADRYPDLPALLDALRSPPRRALVVGAVAGVIAIAVVAPLAVAGWQRAGAGAASCDSAGMPAVKAWSPSARLRVAAHYVKLDARDGPEAADTLAGALDAWSMRWQRAAVTVCESARRSWSDSVGAAAHQCMRASLDQLRALVARAETGPAVIADAAALPNPDDCSDPGKLVGSRAAPAAAIEGHWNGDFGHLVVRRVGDEIWGVYEHDAGTLRGRLVGDSFVGWWCEVPSRAPPGDAGDVEMKVIVDPDGVKAVAGRWRYGGSGDWDDRWDLKVDPTRPSAALTARFDVTADFCSPPGP